MTECVVMRHTMGTPVCLLSSRDPFGEVWGLGADRGSVTVTGMDECFFGKSEQPVADRPDDGREIRVRPARGAGATREQGVAGEQCPGLGQVQAHRPGRVTGRVDHLDLGARDGDRCSSSRCQYLASGWLIFHSTSSPGCSSTGACTRSASSGATVTWSL